MLLAIDIGNTTIAFGILNKGKVLKECSCKTTLPSEKLQSQCRKLLIQLCKEYPSLNDAIICSVVPLATTLVACVIEKQMKIKPLIIGKDVPVPIQNNYANPKQVGQDRLVCAYAAKILYGHPALVIDFGTATTFDCVSAKGAYEGGMIVPGIQLSTQALFQKTALLPRIDKISKPKNLIGKTTNESILSGIFYGYGALSHGLIDQIQKSFKQKAKVIVTGGYASMMKPFIDSKISCIDRDLVFKGIFLVWKTHRE